MLTMSKFFHRTNANCTIDSVCTSCFRTIEVGNTLDELAGAENAHRCEPLFPMGKKKTPSQEYTGKIRRCKRIILLAFLAKGSPAKMKNV
jgi:hypothetical protein